MFFLLFAWTIRFVLFNSQNHILFYCFQLDVSSCLVGVSSPLLLVFRKLLSACRTKYIHELVRSVARHLREKLSWKLTNMLKTKRLRIAHIFLRIHFHGFTMYGALYDLRMVYGFSFVCAFFSPSLSLICRALHSYTHTHTSTYDVHHPVCRDA